MGAQSGEKIGDLGAIAEDLKHSRDAREGYRREEVSEIHSQNSLLIRVFTGEGFDRSFLDKTMCGIVKWDGINDGRKNPALGDLE